MISQKLMKRRYSFNIPKMHELENNIMLVHAVKVSVHAQTNGRAESVMGRFRPITLKEIDGGLSLPRSCTGYYCINFCNKHSSIVRQTVQIQFSYLVRHFSILCTIYLYMHERQYFQCA